MVDRFGQGVRLDDEWDMVIQSGEVELVSEKKEVEKDLAFKLRWMAEDVEGEPMTPRLFSRTEKASKEILLNDPRVDSVIDVDVYQSDTDSGKLNIDALVSAIGEEIQLFVEVNNYGV